MQGEEELSSKITPHTREPDLPATPAGFPPGTVLDTAAAPWCHPSPAGHPAGSPSSHLSNLLQPFSIQCGSKRQILEAELRVHLLPCSPTGTGYGSPRAT